MRLQSEWLQSAGLMKLYAATTSIADWPSGHPDAGNTARASRIVLGLTRPLRPDLYVFAAALRSRTLHAYGLDSIRVLFSKGRSPSQNACDGQEIRPEGSLCEMLV